MAGRLRNTRSIWYRELLFFFLILLLFFPLNPCEPAAPRKWTFPTSAQLNTRYELSQARDNEQCKHFQYLYASISCIKYYMHYFILERKVNGSIGLPFCRISKYRIGDC